MKAVDGRSEAEQLTDVSTTFVQVPLFRTADQGIGYARIRSVLDGEYRVLSLDEDRIDNRLTLQWGPVPALSADGQWFVYSSAETGDFEIYVQPYAGDLGGDAAFADVGALWL